MSDALAAKLVAALAEAGPLTGEMLMGRPGEATFDTWRECRRNPRIETRSIAQQYLRLDERLEGWARLSPSIAREFLTFTVVSLPEQREAAAGFAAALRETTTAVSREKTALAQASVLEVQNRCALSTSAPIVFLIAGDVTYNMAHRARRAEMNTGELVAGSDIDIVVIHADDANPEVIAQVDSELTGIKWRLLRRSREKEELDFVIKPFARVISQLGGSSFRDTLAAKVLVESRFLGGNELLIGEIRAAIEASGAKARMSTFDALARAARPAVEERLLRSDDPKEADLKIFNPAEETQWE